MAHMTSAVSPYFGAFFEAAGLAHEGGHDLTPYPNVRSWLVRVAGQPGNVGIYARPRG